MIKTKKQRSKLLMIGRYVVTGSVK